MPVRPQRVGSVDAIRSAGSPELSLFADGTVAFSRASDVAPAVLPADGGQLCVIFPPSGLKTERNGVTLALVGDEC